MLSSPRRPSSTMRIFSPAEYRLRVFRRISLTLLSNPFSLLIFHSCWDQAIPGVSINKSLDCVSQALTLNIFTTRKAAQSELIDYIGYYNGTRLHSTRGYRPPLEYEKEPFINAA